MSISIIIWEQVTQPVACEPNITHYEYTVELCYNVVDGTEYFVSLQTRVVITEEYNVVNSSEELFGTTECVTL